MRRHRRFVADEDTYQHEHCDAERDRNTHANSDIYANTDIHPNAYRHTHTDGNARTARDHIERKRRAGWHDRRARAAIGQRRIGVCALPRSRLPADRG